MNLTFRALFVFILICLAQNAFAQKKAKKAAPEKTLIEGLNITLCGRTDSLITRDDLIECGRLQGTEYWDTSFRIIAYTFSMVPYGRSLNDPSSYVTRVEGDELPFYVKSRLLKQERGAVITFTDVHCTRNGQKVILDGQKYTMLIR